ncbi:hypothetical protein CV102_02005 [Natronococcus pandeyae]|uniref:Uncharacterized protein n=1 Tax=Natronococcus pandeyae TaxID=2055836 RepID=A0A8J8TS92_9EURY|nr:hypothetical protein [Natronococcus pandeyae]TYL40373.1 hypothetical protein CV102_02005 [Natronococcus pandeyae]
MAERAEQQPIPDRLVCPNCPADYPTPFSRRYITCRRCGSEFLAPDDARDAETDEANAEEVVGDERSEEAADGRSDDRTRRYLQTIQTGAPAIALGFNGAAFCFWLVGIVSFEIAIMTMVLVTNGYLVQDRL